MVFMTVFFTRRSLFVGLWVIELVWQETAWFCPGRQTLMIEVSDMNRN